MLMIMITLAQTDRLVDSGLREKLAEFHLRENPSKRVYFEISHNVRSQPEFKKLGCLLDSRHVSSCSTAFTVLHKNLKSH